MVGYPNPWRRIENDCDEDTILEFVKLETVFKDQRGGGTSPPLERIKREKREGWEMGSRYC